MSRPTISVLIPVYNAFDEAIACVRSVLRYTPEVRRLLLIDDASTSGNFESALDAAGISDSRIEVLRAEQNQGFVHSCNVGFSRLAPDDVVILNSDTEVTPRWLAKMTVAAYSTPAVGTVTPFTNNGTIVSLPRMSVNNEIMPGYSIESFAELVERVSLCRYPKLPTCVGHCVYIKRELLDGIGGFDEESFGRGYGEENDFSIRAERAGFTNILDDATFIFHKGSASFLGDREHLSRKNTKTLLDKYPLFFEQVGQYCRDGVLHSVQTTIHDELVRGWLAGKSGSVLHVVHNGPFVARHHPLGGTELHVRELIAAMPELAHWSLVPGKQCYHLTAHIPGFDREYILDLERASLKTIFRRDFFDLVHVQHSRALDHFELADALPGTTDYVVSFHDFILVCPRLHLYTPTRKACNGHQCATACGYAPAYIERYRRGSERLFSEARALIAFSESTRDLVTRSVPGAFPWRVVPHGVVMDGGRRDIVVQDAPKVGGRPLNVAFVGHLPPHKGSLLIEELLDHSQVADGVPVTWHVFGKLFGKPRGKYIDHGEYQVGQLSGLLAKHSIDIVVILSICPETYCMTLDESWAGGVPVLVTPLGAPAERVARTGAGWLLPELSCAEVLRCLSGIVQDWPGYQAVQRRVKDVSLRSVLQEVEDFRAIYREATKLGRVGAQGSLLRYLSATALRRVPEPSLVKRIAGQVFHRAIVAVERARLRPLLEAALYRLLPTRVLEGIKTLRQNAT